MNYYLSYSPSLNKFLVLNKDTGLSHSVWKDRRDAIRMLKGLQVVKKHFDKNIELQTLNASKIAKNKKRLVYNVFLRIGDVEELYVFHTLRDAQKYEEKVLTRYQGVKTRIEYDGVV